MINWLPLWLKHISYYDRILECVSWHEADRWLAKGWKIAKEEDNNIIYDVIWLCKYELKDKYAPDK